MGLNIYLILLVVLLIFNLVFWVIVIWFRIFYDCDGLRNRRNSNARSRQSSDGQTNPGFTDQEDPARTLQRPFTVPDAMESPPSYEEALKHDQFGFRIFYPQDILVQRLRPNPQSSREGFIVPIPSQILPEAVPGMSSTAEPRHVTTSNYASSLSFEDSSGNGTISHSPLSSSMSSDAISRASPSSSSTITTSHSSTFISSIGTASHSSASSSSSGTIFPSFASSSYSGTISHSSESSRSNSTVPHNSTSSHNLTSPLSTIAEEDDSTVPVTLVIDCIGVQAARLIENCDTTVNLTNGQDLDTHSKC